MHMYDVITIGTATRDVFIQTPENTACFEPGAKIDVAQPLFASGGGAVNAAITFARQGLKTAAVFRVGADPAGDAILAELEKENIQCFAVRDTESGTAYATIFLLPNGERTVLAYRGAAEVLPDADVPFAQLQAKWVYIAPSRIASRVVEKIVEHCFYQGIAVAFNPSQMYLEQHGKKMQSLLARAKAVIVNRDEAAMITGAPRDNEKEIFSRFDALVGGMAIMTDGPRGAWVSDGKKMYHAGIFKNKVVDRTGAGDAFGGGFITGYIMKEDVEYALRFATANAAAVVEQMGAHTGALTRSAFERDSRWKNLEIKKGSI